MNQTELESFAQWIRDNVLTHDEAKTIKKQIPYSFWLFVGDNKCHVCTTKELVKIYVKASARI